MNSFEICHSPESYLEKLPEELLYHLFDWLDTQSLLVNLSQTCHRLRDLTFRYNRNHLQFDYISRIDFHRVCHSVRPEKVIALSLTNHNRIPQFFNLFLTLIPTYKLKQLRSLSLYYITEEQLSIWLNDQSCFRNLRSCSIHLIEGSEQKQTNLGSLLSLFLIHTRLNRFELSIPTNIHFPIDWPEKCTIQRLTLSTRLELNQLCRLLNSLPYLKILTITSIDDCPIRDDFQPFLQIVSMTLQQLSIDMNQLQYLLSLMPSLTHLRIITKDKIINGSQWEQIIVRHLSKLNLLEFSMHQWSDTSYTLQKLLQYLTTFRTPFWVEAKKWCVVAEYCIDSDKTLHLYTVPLCLSSIIFQPISRMISISNFQLPYENAAHLMNNIETLQLNIAALTSYQLEYSHSFHSHDQEEKMDYPLFGHVKTLQLLFSHTYPREWIAAVSQIVNVTTVETMHLNGLIIRQAHPQLMNDIADLLKKSTRILALHICDEFFMRKSNLAADQLCTIVPNHIKHLGVSIQSLDEARKILKRLPFLCSAHFYFDSKCTPNKPPGWLNEEQRHSIFKLGDFFLQIWLATDKG